jgi:hypothetical protein
MMHSIPKGLTREHVMKALAELDAGAKHPFGYPTAFDLVHKGKSYVPKAVIGLAARHLLGHMLQPKDFSSGSGPGQAVRVLRDLGFKVVRMDADWSQTENTLIVADYFEMLWAELQDLPYSKTEHRRKLTEKLNERSDGSIEFKHQNISAVLVSMGLPYIDGYKPRSNTQSLLTTTVEKFIAAHPEFCVQLADAKRLNPTQVPVLSTGIGGLFVPPPERIIVPDPDVKPWLSRRGKKVDFARRDAENRRMGKLGEQFVLGIEKKRLHEAGRDDLAAKVEWVADTCGDGLGYDVLSFNEANDHEKWVEVKTTGLGKFFPFYVTRNEVKCSEAEPERFRLYRVFDFSREARLYVLPGALSQVCELEPIQFRARLRTNV